MGIPKIELRKLTANDLSVQPDCFKNDVDKDAECYMFANYGMLFVEDEKKPLFYFRHSGINNPRWAGIVHLGDGPFSTQTSAHHNDIAQSDTECIPWKLVNEEKGIYEISSKDPFSKLSYSPDEFEWIEGKEGSILNIKGKPIPFAIFVHQNDIQDTYILQYATLEGTYEGRPVKGFMAHDRIFHSTINNVDVIKPDYTYTLGIYSGIREDGRREIFDAYFKDENGKGIAIYWLEGEDPIFTDECVMEADWHHLPYVPEGDNTVVATEITYRMPNGPEIHYTGKWGAKGFTEKPRIERVGQSHSLGTWYVGDKPYKHSIWSVLNENMNATPERINKMGLKVVD